MTHTTQARKLRTFDWDKDRGIFRREQRLEAKPRKDAGPCFYCSQPVMVSEGQIITGMTDRDGTHPTHKACRKNRRFGNK